MLGHILRHQIVLTYSRKVRESDAFRALIGAIASCLVFTKHFRVLRNDESGVQLAPAAANDTVPPRNSHFSYFCPSGCSLVRERELARLRANVASGRPVPIVMPRTLDERYKRVQTDLSRIRPAH